MQEKIDIIFRDLNKNRYTRKFNIKELEKIKIINEKFKLENYLLVDFPDNDLAYDFYKSTKLSFSDFICKYNLDHIIKMDKKDLFKLNRNITKKIKSISNLENKIKTGKKLNKNEIMKYNSKLELTFKKKQIDFYKKYFNK